MSKYIVICNYLGNIKDIQDKIYKIFDKPNIIEINCLNIEEFILNIEKSSLPLKSIFKKTNIILFNEYDGILATTSTSNINYIKKLINDNHYPIYITTNQSTLIL